MPDDRPRWWWTPGMRRRWRQRQRWEERRRPIDEQHRAETARELASRRQPACGEAEQPFTLANNPASVYLAGLQPPRTP